MPFFTGWRGNVFDSPKPEAVFRPFVQAVWPYIDSATYNVNREGLMERLGKNGIQARPVWTLNHMQKPYRNCQSYKIEKAEKLANISLCLPSSTNLIESDICKVIGTLNG